MHNYCNKYVMNINYSESLNICKVNAHVFIIINVS